MDCYGPAIFLILANKALGRLGRVTILNYRPRRRGALENICSARIRGWLQSSMKSCRAQTSIVAVIVTYQPDIGELIQLLRVLKDQVSAIVVVDNGSNASHDLEEILSREEAIFIQNGINLGVAEGQNRGIWWAKEYGADFVILFDQDSLPGNQMVQILASFARRKIQEGEKVGAVGPTNIDGRWDKPLPFVKIKYGVYIRIFCKADEEFVVTDHIISSGALIPMATLAEVGAMRSELFIDYIDVEWCLRARASNFTVYGLRDAQMVHSLGNSVFKIGTMKLTMHSASRDYYLFRNAVWMLRQAWIPFSWKFAEGKRILLRFLLYSLFAKPRAAQIKLMTLGILDGIRSKLGERT